MVERRRKCWGSSIGTTIPCLASLVLKLHWRRGDVGGRAPPLEEKVKNGGRVGKNSYGGLREEWNPNLLLV